ncbi:DUF6538 domain-containing protein [Methylobacterium oxalidis]|uniref:DUF6538 domain-containing protein n=1 Tax=Methylobacterium oxalidis TaxID=944322 RepID=UPI00331603D5
MVLALARPWRHPKTGMYWFRRRVPKDLQPLLGRSEERCSLGTKEAAVARTRHLEKAAEVDRRWQRLRCGEAALEAGSTVPSIGQRPPRFGPIREPPSPPSTVPSKPQPASPPVPWLPLFEAYAAESKLAPATVKRWAGVFAALEGAVGTDDLSRLERSDLLAWKVDLLGAGKEPRTVRDVYFAALKAVLNWAVANGRLEANPAAGILVKVPQNARIRDPEFTDGEVVLILRATFGPHDRRLSETHAAARRWIPWLCAYTGARVNELTQLRGSDLACDAGVWLVRITPEAGSVKSKRWREVPLHPHLVEQGFVSFVRERGPGPLFYDPSRSRDGSPANPTYKKVGERLAAWVRSIGVTDPGVEPNHGWRHRFKTVGRRAGIDPAVLDAIQGHAPRTEGDRYGRHPADVLAAAIARIPRLSPPNEPGAPS